jgi:hypothetical protein
MDRFVILSTTKEQSGAVKLSDALEVAGIPFIVQHKRNKNKDDENPNFVVLVPDRYISNASQIANNKNLSGH